MRIGVLGLGHWGTKLVLEYGNLLSSGVINGVQGYDPRFRVPSLTLNNGFPLTMAASVASLIDQTDAVHVAAPDPLHYELAAECLDRHRPVLVEKPMARSYAEAVDLMGNSKRRGLRLHVGQLYRYSASIHSVANIIRGGSLGGPCQIRLEWKTDLINVRGRVLSADDDIRWDLLPHALDILHQVTGNWPAASRCDSTRSDSGAIVESGVRLDYPSGVTAAISLSWISPRRVRLLEATGPAGAIHGDFVTQQYTITSGGRSTSLLVERNDPLQEELRHFTRRTDGRDSPAPNSAEFGAEVVRQIERIISPS